MCVYMLEPCVLLGLDWVEPMMQFSLHVTCSCIIHTYIPFSFSYLVLSVDGAFLFVSLSLSLSLTLSLSLSHSLHMAPKPKTTPSRNPLHVWFHNEKACQDFSKNFSRRGIHSKHHVVLSDFFDTFLPTIIHSQG